jgi:hypothetical protein
MSAAGKLAAGGAATGELGPALSAEEMRTQSADLEEKFIHAFDNSSDGTADLVIPDGPDPNEAGTIDKYGTKVEDIIEMFDQDEKEQAPASGIITGVLEKKGHLVRSWRSRFFRFDPTDRTLKYYETEAQMEAQTDAKGTLTVTSICDVPQR